MEPQNNQYTEMPNMQTPLPTSPKGLSKWKKIISFIVVILLVLVALATYYVYTLDNASRCKIFALMSIKSGCGENNPSDKSQNEPMFKTGEWVSGKTSYIPGLFLDKMPIDKGVTVEHLFVKMPEDQYQALDRYQSVKTADQILREYKKFGEEAKFPLLSENNTKELKSVSFGKYGSLVITIDLKPAEDSKKQNVNIFYSFKATSKSE